MKLSFFRSLATTLVVELPQALLALLQQVIGRPPLGENPPT